MLPGTRCQVLGWQTPGGVELTRPGQILAPDPGTGGLFLGLRLRLQRRGAEDGAGQSPGNRLDDVTLTGGGRVPQGGGRAAVASSTLGFVVPEGRGAAWDIPFWSQARSISQTARARTRRSRAPWRGNAQESRPPLHCGCRGRTPEPFPTLQAQFPRRGQSHTTQYYGEKRTRAPAYLST